MVGMDLGGAPVGDLVGLTVPGQQGVAHLVLEDHQGLSPGGAVDPLARRFQGRDHGLQLLTMGRPHEAMPRVRQHHDQRPHRPALARGRVGDHAQSDEVHLGHFAGLGVGHRHGVDIAPSPVAFPDEPAQRRVRHRAAPRFQQLLDARHLQPVAGQPLVNLVSP